ncbi:hypothetical protein [Petrachloros mirabilis]
MTTRLWTIFVTVIGLLCSSFTITTTLAADNPDPQKLWRAVPPPQTPQQEPEPPRPWVLREREIALNPSLFAVLKDAAARPHPRITVELFDGARYDLDITSTVSRIDGTAIVRGQFKPPAQGTFTFVGNDNLLIGTIRVANRLYKTEHIANGRLRLLEVDPEKAPPE